MIYSSWPLPDRYRTISGTSMATPFIAGILALLYEKNPNNCIFSYTSELISNARRLAVPNFDVGSRLGLSPT